VDVNERVVRALNDQKWWGHCGDALKGRHRPKQILVTHERALDNLRFE
jgi:hypothetical protein